MKKYPDSKWRIEGHTDSQGSAEFNKRLSQERADTVRKYLISLGIPAENLVAEGMGENYPIADNKTEEGRQKNRRVVVTKIK
jgi:outer membrane protein OmpA-like peptidoglycan-associated protein